MCLKAGEGEGDGCDGKLAACCRAVRAAVSVKMRREVTPGVETVVASTTGDVWMKIKSVESERLSTDLLTKEDELLT